MQFTQVDYVMCTEYFSRQHMYIQYILHGRICIHTFTNILELLESVCICVLEKLSHLCKTSAPIGAWKCNFSPIEEIMTKLCQSNDNVMANRPSNQLTGIKAHSYTYKNYVYQPTILRQPVHSNSKFRPYQARKEKIPQQNTMINYWI